MAIARKLLTDFGTLKENCGNMDARRMDNLCEELQALMRVPELLERLGAESDYEILVAGVSLQSWEFFQRRVVEYARDRVPLGNSGLGKQR